MTYFTNGLFLAICSKEASFLLIALFEVFSNLGYSYIDTMKFSLATLALIAVSASAFVQQPTFSRTTSSLGAMPTPSKDDLEKTRKVIADFMNKDEKEEEKPAKKEKKSKKEKEEA